MQLPLQSLKPAHTASDDTVPLQNMTLALGAVIAATLPTVAGVLPLSMAVLVHEGSTLLVALNSLRYGKPCIVWIVAF